MAKGVMSRFLTEQRNYKRQNGDRPGIPGPAPGPVCSRCVSPPRITQSETAQSVWNETAVRYHHRRSGHPQARRQTSPVMDHLRDNHRQGDNCANDQKQIMRRPNPRSSHDTHRTLPARFPKINASSQEMSKQKRDRSTVLKRIKIGCNALYLQK